MIILLIYLIIVIIAFANLYRLHKQTEMFRKIIKVFEIGNEAFREEDMEALELSIEMLEGYEKEKHNFHKELYQPINLLKLCLELLKAKNEAEKGNLN